MFEAAAKQKCVMIIDEIGTGRLYEMRAEMLLQGLVVHPIFLHSPVRHVPGDPSCECTRCALAISDHDEKEVGTVGGTGETEAGLIAKLVEEARGRVEPAVSAMSVSELGVIGDVVDKENTMLPRRVVGALTLLGPMVSLMGPRVETRLLVSVAQVVTRLSSSPEIFPSASARLLIFPVSRECPRLTVLTISGRWNLNK